MDTSKNEEHGLARNLKDKHNIQIVLQEVEPYSLFHAIDVSRVLQIKCIRASTIRFDATEKQILRFSTNGGIQKVSFLTMKGLKRLVGACRTTEANTFANVIGMEKRDYAVWSIEGKTLKCIADSFQGEVIYYQHTVNNYRVDMYMPVYNLVIECDELHHLKSTNLIADVDRQKYIEDAIGCTFIRFQPYSDDFNMFEVINRIFIHMKKCMTN
jgi:very-short-patch-repair endonuclease/urease beta subunit